MFGALKRLFSKPAEPEPSPAPPPQPTPVKPSAPAAPVKREPPPPAPPAPAPLAAVRAAPTPAPSSRATFAGPEESIQLPLASIVATLPPNLTALATGVSAGTFSLPVQTALAQLPSGSVKIPFGQLRQGSPAGAFANNASLDQTLVTLPLSPIIAAIDPVLLARRPGRKVASVPENVTSVFGKHRSFNAAAAVAPTATPESATPILEPPAPLPPAHLAPTLPPAPKPIAPASATGPMSAPTIPAPDPGASHFTRPPATPSIPSSIPRPPAAVPLPAAPVKPPVSAPLPSMAAKAPTPAPMPFAAPRTPSLPVPAPSAAEAEALAIPLSTISESWPPGVLQEIAQSRLQDATVSLPIARLDAAMKTGRVVFTWGELSQWLQPAATTTASAHRETTLELPLKIIAPLFLARRRPATAQKKVAIGANIPDLFAGMAKAPEPSAPAAATPVPLARPEPAAAPASALGEILGQPEKAEWSPQEICARICDLRGVAGSVLAMGDGLLVAGQLPAPLTTETVAAFLPQIFGRVSHYAGEMQLASVTSIVIGTGPTPCGIYKTGNLYLAVLGQPGEALPETTLGRIAAELAKRNP